jgi:hypothetical protein
MFLDGLIIGLACALTGVLGGCILCLWLFRDDGRGGDWDIAELDPDPNEPAHA